jgi:hypothetical protein
LEVIVNQGKACFLKQAPFSEKGLQTLNQQKSYANKQISRVDQK